MLYVRKVNGPRLAYWAHEIAPDHPGIYEVSHTFALLPVDLRALLLDSKGQHTSILLEADEQVPFEIYDRDTYKTSTGAIVGVRNPVPATILEVKLVDIPCLEGEIPLWDFFDISVAARRKQVYDDILMTLRILGVRNSDTEIARVGQ